MQKLFLSLFIGSALLSCKKNNAEPISSIDQNPAFNIVGTWQLTTAKVTVEGKDVSISKADITKSGFFKPEGLETTFTVDGKYTRGAEIGSYAVLSSGLKLGASSYNSFTSPDPNTFIYGNVWGEGNPDASLKSEVFFVSQKILDNVQVPLSNTSKSVTYLFTYKKK